MAICIGGEMCQNFDQFLQISIKKWAGILEGCLLPLQVQDEVNNKIHSFKS